MGGVGPPNLEADPWTGKRLPLPMPPPMDIATPMPPPAPRPVPPGQAQPKVDPAAAATSPQDEVRNQIATALKEMFPELDPGKIQQLSAQLAADYQRERTAAVDSLRPEAPMAQPTEQMAADEAYANAQTAERAEDRMRRRMEQQLRQEQADSSRMDSARRRSEQSLAASRQQMLRESHVRQYGEQSAMQKYGPRPRHPGDELAAGLPSPGMAQPAQDPYETSAPAQEQQPRPVNSGEQMREEQRAAARGSQRRNQERSEQMSEAGRQRRAAARERVEAYYWDLVGSGVSNEQAAARAKQAARDLGVSFP